MTSRQDLIPREIRALVARLGLPKPIWYVGRLNHQPDTRISPRDGGGERE